MDKILVKVAFNLETWFAFSNVVVLLHIHSNIIEESRFFTHSAISFGIQI